MTEQHWEVLIVGAGPAGMAAAIAASRHAERVAVIDDNLAPGGQIWRRGLSHESDSSDAAQQRTQHDLAASQVTLLPGRRVVAAAAARSVDTWHDGDGTAERHHYGKLVLATGARERFLPFPCWTLPGVYGAGGLQALVRGGYDVTGKLVVVAGTGPLLLAVAAHLKQDGAHVLSVCEQAGLAQMLPFGLRLWNKPAKLKQSARLMRDLLGVPYRRGCWPVRAIGTHKLQAVELTDGKRRWTEPCDLLACGFHLVPNTELAALLGCQIENGAVSVDSMQRTSVEHVFCAGEPTGIAGVDSALVEGEIAGLAAVGANGEAARLSRRAEQERAFGVAMGRAFRLRPELLSLADASTIVCRCEDVSFGQLQPLAQRGDGWTDAKLQTRCGMGPCQGRICGPAVDALFGWKNESVRPPIFPLPLAALASEMHGSETYPNAAQQETQ